MIFHNLILIVYNIDFWSLSWHFFKNKVKTRYIERNKEKQKGIHEVLAQNIMC